MPRAGSRPPAWRLRMTLMTSPFQGKKVQRFFHLAAYVKSIYKRPCSIYSAVCAFPFESVEVKLFMQFWQTFCAAAFPIMSTHQCYTHRAQRHVIWHAAFDPRSIYQTFKLINNVCMWPKRCLFWWVDDGQPVRVFQASCVHLNLFMQANRLSLKHFSVVFTGPCLLSFILLVCVSSRQQRSNVVKKLQL